MIPDRGLAGAVELVVRLPGGRLWAIEIKWSLTAKVERGFHNACEDHKPERRIVIYPATERYPLDADITVIASRWRRASDAGG